MPGPIAISRDRTQPGYFWTSFRIFKENVGEYTPKNDYLNVGAGGDFYIAGHTPCVSFYETDEFWVDKAGVEKTGIIPLWAIISKTRKWSEERGTYIHDLFLRKRSSISKGEAKRALESVVKEIKNKE